MLRAQKVGILEDLKEIASANTAFVVAHYRGLTVAQISELRSEMQKEGAGFKVAKNTLLKIAVQGTSFEKLQSILTGPTAIAYSKDPVTAAKLAVKFAKGKENFQIIGGAVNGQLLTKDQVETLSKLPSLDELRSKIVGILVAPATRVATVTQAPASKLARVFKAYADKAA